MNRQNRLALLPGNQPEMEVIMWIDTFLLGRAVSLTLILLGICNILRPIWANGQLHIAIMGKTAGIGKRMAFKDEGIHYIGTVVAEPGDLLLPGGAVYGFPSDGAPPVVSLMWTALEARPDTVMVSPDCYCVKTGNQLVFVTVSALLGAILI